MIRHKNDGLIVPIILANHDRRDLMRERETVER
jgi:hypothetical protein